LNSRHYGTDLQDTPTNVFGQHRSFFQYDDGSGNWEPREPQSSLEAGNMEWWFLTMGRPHYDISSGSITDAYEGRWGELDRLASGVNPNNGTAFMNPGAFPRAGRASVDDNANEGEALAQTMQGTIPL